MANTITSKGQVTIPKRIRDYLGLAAGEKVEFELGADGRVIVRRASGDKPPSRFAKYRGSLKVDMTTDQMMKLLRSDD